MFKLLENKVCSAAMCLVVGFSNPTWKEAKHHRETGLFVETVHGNTVSGLNIQNDSLKFAMLVVHGVIEQPVHRNVLA